MTVKAFLLGAAAAAAFAAPAAALTITFDDLPSSSGFPISNGYDGFDWSNAYALSSSAIPGTGYQYGVVSPHNAAYDGFASGASFTSVSGTFALNSAYFTGAWASQDVTVTGFFGSTQIDSVTFAVSETSPTFETFNWAGLTSVHWISSSHLQTVVDNVTVTEVPEPSTWAMMGLGLAGLAVSGFLAGRPSAAAA